MRRKLAGVIAVLTLLVLFTAQTVVVGVPGGILSQLLRAPDGAAAAPAYSFANDAAMGMFRAGTNALQFSVGGASKLQLQTAGFGFPGNGTHGVSASATNDATGTIALSAATSAAKTFTTAYGSAPNCLLTPTSNLGTTSWWVTTSTTAVTANVSTASTVTFNYWCWGAPN